ncbi:MAG: hypothetical protein WC455_09220 [Dehalococcoidia bacterium]|jgi:hypothetical protein
MKEPNFVGPCFLMTFGLITLVYSAMMCFEINPLGIPIYPGLVAIAGVIILLGGDSWLLKEKRRRWFR